VKLINDNRGTDERQNSMEIVCGLQSRGIYSCKSNTSTIMQLYVSVCDFREQRTNRLKSCWKSSNEETTNISKDFVKHLKLPINMALYRDISSSSAYVFIKQLNKHRFWCMHLKFLCLLCYHVVTLVVIIWNLLNSSVTMRSANIYLTKGRWRLE